jgi:hypothetical protein
VDKEQKNGQQQQFGKLWAAGIFLIVLVFLLVVLGGYAQGWEWTGLTTPKQRTFWDWLDLLIVPAVLAVGGYLLTRSENERTRQSAERQRDLDQDIADQRTEEDRKIAQERAESDRQIAEQRRQDDALQAYLDHIGVLLLDKDKPLRQSKQGDEVRTLARARTLTVLERLDGEGKGVVVRFLIESGLIQQQRVDQSQPTLDIPREASIVRLVRKFVPSQQEEPAQEEPVNKQPIISLSGASLSDTDLSAASLVGADLRGTDMRNTDLTDADLSGALMGNADLRGAHADFALISVELKEADLDEADLRDVKFPNANMIRTNGSLLKYEKNRVPMAA